MATSSWSGVTDTARRKTQSHGPVQELPVPLMAESVRQQLLRLVDQLLSTPLPADERENLLRQMRHLLEPPRAEENDQE